MSRPETAPGTRFGAPDSDLLCLKADSWRIQASAKSKSQSDSCESAKKLQKKENLVFSEHMGSSCIYTSLLYCHVCNIYGEIEVSSWSVLASHASCDLLHLLKPQCSIVFLQDSQVSLIRPRDGTMLDVQQVRSKDSHQWRETSLLFRGGTDPEPGPAIVKASNAYPVSVNEKP